MPTAGERQAMAFLAAVALLGGGMRAWQNHQFNSDVGAAASERSARARGAEGVGDQLAAVDGARSARKGKRSGKPSSKPPKAPAVVDVDVASGEQLETLPRVGAALAQRIIANRDSFGAFGSLDALGEVRGIGQGMQAALEPLVRFSGTPSGLRGRAMEVPNTRAATASKPRKPRSKRAKDHSW